MNFRVLNIDIDIIFNWVVFLATSILRTWSTFLGRRLSLWWFTRRSRNTLCFMIRIAVRIFRDVLNSWPIYVVSSIIHKYRNINFVISNNTVLRILFLKVSYLVSFVHTNSIISMILILSIIIPIDNNFLICNIFSSDSVWIITESHFYIEIIFSISVFIIEIGKSFLILIDPLTNFHSRVILILVQNVKEYYCFTIVKCCVDLIYWKFWMFIKFHSKLISNRTLWCYDWIDKIISMIVIVNICAPNKDSKGKLVLNNFILFHFEE